MILFFDLESSDLLKRELPLGDPAQPWIVEIAAELVDHDGTARGCLWTRIKSEGRKVRPGAESVHGVSSRQAARGGVTEIRALSVLLGMADQAEYVVAFGMPFDRDVVKSALMRMDKNVASWTRPGLEFVCAMEIATQVCKLPSTFEGGGYKWPSLDEASEIILGEEPRQGHHGALDDLRRLQRLYFALKERGLGVEERAA